MQVDMEADAISNFKLLKIKEKIVIYQVMVIDSLNV